LSQGDVLFHSNNNVINILLPYDPNAPTDPNLWDGSLHPVSLHRSLEHLASDAKNIKDSLNFIAKYIDNKQIDLFKSNDMEDLKGIGMAIWNFMSSVYQSKWDSLNTDNNRKSLRDKITTKLSPRVISQPSYNNKPMEKPVSTSIEKMPPLLPAKLKNEVNLISKYFKSTSTKSHAQASKQSYTQALKLNTNTNKVLKIKNMFPALNTQKIDQIQKIINGAPKPKPCIQMITKDSSRKQVIIPISSNNIKKFMKNSSLHIANINCSL